MPRPDQPQKRQDSDEMADHAGQQLANLQEYLRLTDWSPRRRRRRTASIGMVRAAETTATARPESGDVQGEKACSQQLEKSHGVDAATDRQRRRNAGVVSSVRRPVVLWI